MSTPIASRTDLGRSRPARRTERPSIREVCLVGASALPDSPPQHPRATLDRSGRTYLVRSMQGPAGSDPRRYLHLVVAPGTDGA
ncbi:hypothetical protein [Tautonia plasticadhaerens]|uniref:Uncharacterized protein n=1 Tax=Tautonia plasticadhaerens TaxID=2527974 RepID=A0A518GYA1_9BACT|nr:hypothetical protein [Tautonia plasticadhaerens]QDV33576.1 hypothetical protein ElP_14500 [Tautonia plasticadhaerens]